MEKIFLKKSILQVCSKYMYLKKHFCTNSVDPDQTNPAGILNIMDFSHILG